MHVFLLKVWREKLDVSTATVDALLVFYSELYHKRLVLVVEILKSRWQRIEMGVLTGLKTCAFTTSNTPRHLRSDVTSYFITVIIIP